MIDNKILIITALLLFILAYGYISISKISSLSEQLNIERALYEDLQAEKKLSDDSLARMKSIREQIHEQVREQFKETEKVLKDNSSWSDTAIPDDVRERLFKQKPDTCVLPSTSNTPS